MKNSIKIIIIVIVLLIGFANSITSVMLLAFYRL